MPWSPRSVTILVVDDMEQNLRFIERALGIGDLAHIISLHDPSKALYIFDEVRPDLVLLDVHMPRVDGLQILRTIRSRQEPGTYLPVIMMTVEGAWEAKREALTTGADDILVKPFDPVELRLRVKNLLHTRALHVQLEHHTRTLEEKVQERTQELEAAHRELIERLSMVAELRDDDTGHHTRRVGSMAAEIAHALGLGEQQVELIRQAAPLHDVGKIGTPDRILLKNDRLDEEEWQIMKQHTQIGTRLLSGGRYEVLKLAETIASTHHERWDGNGYPNGLSGDKIPLVGRIVAVADCFDALTNERPYKSVWPVEEAIAEIKRQAGHQFDPRVVDAFLSVIDRRHAYQ